MAFDFKRFTCAFQFLLHELIAVLKLLILKNFILHFAKLLPFGGLQTLLLKKFSHTLVDVEDRLPRNQIGTCTRYS